MRGRRFKRPVGLYEWGLLKCEERQMAITLSEAGFYVAQRVEIPGFAPELECFLLHLDDCPREEVG